MRTFFFSTNRIRFAADSIVFLCAVALFASTNTAEAFSATYGKFSGGPTAVGSAAGTSKSILIPLHVPESLCNFCHYGRLYIDNPSVTIQYAVTVKRVSTGTLVMPGSTIQTGERIQFLFKPHDDSDIYWFATGHFLSSPYGDWISKNQLGANAPDVVPAEAGGSLAKICTPKNQITNTISETGAAFGSLSVNAPVKRIDGMSGYSCTRIAPSSSNFSSSVGPINGGGLDCVFTSPGVINPVFVFEAVSGHFFTNASPAPRNDGQCSFQGPVVTHSGAAYTLGTNRGVRGHALAGAPSARYTLSVPAKSIPFPLTVVTASGTPPTIPNLTASSVACVVGTPHTFSMTSTDPDGDRVRYGIDWTADGIIDQFVPPTGFMSSGQSTTTRRTFSVPGTKTVRVLAQDEKGMMSGWSSFSFNCTASDITTNQTIITDDTVGGGFTDGGNGIGIGTGNGTGATLADLVLRAVPSLIRRGETTKVSWSAANVASCTVTGENGDSWGGLVSPIGGRVSAPITQRTTFTLTCLSGHETLVKSAVVNVLPNWEEQ
jgi:hypothetical protein